jgi:hypothetical protein
VAAAGLIGVVLAGPSIATGQTDYSDLRAQFALDSLVYALVAGSPAPGMWITTRLVASKDHFAGVVDTGAGATAVVSTRFGRESSRDALAAALAIDLYPNAVYAAITLHRGGFDGPAGFAELHNRVVKAAWLGAVDVEYQKRMAALWEVYRAEINLAAYYSVVRDGFRPIYFGHIQALLAEYRQLLAAYWAFQATLTSNSYTLRPVPADLVYAVAEITAVLRGEVSFEASPWGPQIKAALERFPDERKE